MARTIVGLTLNYRDAERTSRCITSLLSDGAVAVMVWDNSADHDTSAQILRQRWRHDPRVHIEGNGHNLGFAAGVNRGIEAILQRWPNAWIMLINNDAIVLPCAIETLSVALENQPHAVIAYPRVDHNGRVIGTMFYQRYFALLRFDKPWPGSFPYPSGSALLIAPERIKLPLFDEDFFMYGEDVMLGWRLGAKRMDHVQQILVWHEGSASSGMATPFYENQLVAAHWCIARKIAHHGWDYALLFAARLLSLPVRAALRSLRYRSAIPLFALWRGWRLSRKSNAN